MDQSKPFSSIKSALRTQLAGLGKYKYIALIFLFGLCLMVLPERTEAPPEGPPSEVSYELSAEELEELLQCIDGAGRVKVLLTLAEGPHYEYQTDTSVSQSQDHRQSSAETVLIGSSSQEAPVPTVIQYPVYRGAVVLCEGADSALVRLHIADAVASLTGLGTDQIKVIKMYQDKED